MNKELYNKKIGDLTLRELGEICGDITISCEECPINEICSWFKPAPDNIKKEFLEQEVTLSDTNESAET